MTPDRASASERRHAPSSSSSSSVTSMISASDMAAARAPRRRARVWRARAGALESEQSKRTRADKIEQEADL